MTLSRFLGIKTDVAEENIGQVSQNASIIYI